MKCLDGPLSFLLRVDEDAKTVLVLRLPTVSVPVSVLAPLFSLHNSSGRVHWISLVDVEDLQR